MPLYTATEKKAEPLSFWSSLRTIFEIFIPLQTLGQYTNVWKFATIWKILQQHMTTFHFLYVYEFKILKENSQLKGEEKI